MFDRIAPSYDILNRILSASIDRYWRKKTIQSLGIGENCLVLDIATGTGDLALGALHDTTCRVVGVDLSLGMLRQATRKSGLYLKNRLFLVNGDATTLPFRDGVFDRAMVAFGIRNVSGVDRCLDEMCRVVKPAGRIAILELSVPSSPLFRKAYFAYFKHILPLIGGLISGNTRAYRYLRDSVMDFLPPERLVEMIKQRGCTVALRSFFGGVARLYSITREKVEEKTD